jgi:hemoglobin-like flavoprotein
MDLRSSVQEILGHEELVTRLFYELFLSRYEDVRQVFAHVDLGRQAVLLRMALPVIQMHHEHGYPATREYLELLGHKHKLRGVPVDLFPDFRDCLLDMLEQFHGEAWTEALEEEWCAAIQEASDAMIAGYHSKRFD